MGLDIFFKRRQSKDIGYFRKVNFLVKYFADLGFDVYNQTPFIINKEDVEELLSRCNKVLKDHSKAKELLPTMDGFFFGSIEYNNNYFDDVLKVRDYVDSELLPQFDDLENNESIEFSTWY